MVTRSWTAAQQVGAHRPLTPGVPPPDLVSYRSPLAYVKRRLLGGALLRICSSFPGPADYAIIYRYADMRRVHARGSIQVRPTTSLFSSSSDS
jgi:hypothetical protein